MTAAAGMPDDHRRYRREVEDLLEQIRLGVDRLERMMARGVRSAALAEQRRQLAAARARLASLVGGASGSRAA